MMSYLSQMCKLFSICVSQNVVENYKKDGDDIQLCDTYEFTFPVEGGRVIKVYDGDTITIATKLPFKMETPLYRFSIRLNGIDTPEMKGKDVTAEEKNAAQKAQKFVSNLVLNKYVTLKNIKNEKYGRILADVYIGEIHLNQLLLNERYAVAYSGETKLRPKSWLKYKETGEL
jgi:endonuclease YncB( thermonuclease family)